MTRLEGPKRYIPIWDKVHEPAWANDLTDPRTGPHDLPLSDGITGEIGLTIEAVTPLFVGARQTDVGHEGKEGKRKHWLELDGKRAIQGTAVKGAIRSVIEIATQGRFAGRIDERRLSIRDLQNREDYIDHLTDMFRPLSRAGWLNPSPAGWTLTPCEWSLVRQVDLERQHPDRIDLGKRQTAAQKYKAWGMGRLSIAFDPLSHSTEGDYAKGREVSRVANLGSGSTTGHIVLTGQPQDRGRSKTAKTTEFIFHTSAVEPVEVPRIVRRDFEQIHREADGTPNAEWGMWLAEARAGNPVPVFWLENPDGSIKAMGLAMMFRLPYQKSLREAAKINSETIGNRPVWDMADLIFGRVFDERSEQTDGLDLRGRASFGHFLQTCRTPLMQEQETVLLAPKYGFYPANIRQMHIAEGMPPHVHEIREKQSSRPKNRYTTLQHADARLRGPSRYVASRGYQIERPGPDARGNVNRKIVTRVTPVKAGAKFEGTLRVFNLKPEELGALVWALTWGGDGENLATASPVHAHMLGAAKSMGLGACRITIDADRTELAQNPDYERQQGAEAKQVLENAAKAFRTYHADHLSAETLAELKTLAALDHGDQMRAQGKLTPMRDPKPFLDAKKAGLVLPLASGGVEVAPSRPPTTQGGGTGRPGGNQQRPNRPPPRPSTPAWREGDAAWHVEEGMEVTIVRTVRPGDKTALVDFGGGDTEDVSLTMLKKP